MSGAIREEALWRSPADSWWAQGGEPCEVLAQQDEDGEVRYRVRFADGEEMWAPSEEVSFEMDGAAPTCLSAGQAGLFSEDGFGE